MNKTHNIINQGKAQVLGEYVQLHNHAKTPLGIQSNSIAGQNVGNSKM